MEMRTAHSGRTEGKKGREERKKQRERFAALLSSAG